MVFIAAPHRGSNTANRMIGRLSSSLVARRGAPQAFHGEIVALNGEDVFQPAYRRRAPNGIDNLAWESPILKALSELPITPESPTTRSSRTSSLTAHPASGPTVSSPLRAPTLTAPSPQMMVRHNHFANDTPEAAVEVRRILRLHLGG